MLPCGRANDWWFAALQIQQRQGTRLWDIFLFFSIILFWKFYLLWKTHIMVNPFKFDVSIQSILSMSTMWDAKSVVQKIKRCHWPWHSSECCARNTPEKNCYRNQPTAVENLSYIYDSILVVITGCWLVILGTVGSALFLVNINVIPM